MLSKGFSLLELMIAIAIAGILLAVAVPNLSDFTVKMRVDNQIAELRRMLLVARNNGINTGQTTTICPLSSANVCENKWQNPITIFNDLNNNGTYEPANETIILIKDSIQTGDTLTFARTLLTYTPEGQLTGFNNGTFLYCPKGYGKYARGVIIATSGRNRATTDTNNDGIDNDSQGANLACP